MLSARSFTRSAPRAFSRAAASATLRPYAAGSFRSGALLKASPLGAVRLTRPAASAAFSTSALRRGAEGESDEELSAKLESEIQIEEEMANTEQQPASIKDFLDNSPFELVDTPGQEVVKLERSFGDEKITVSFSIADVTNYDQYNEDPALEDEDSIEDALQGSDKPGSQSPSGRAADADSEANELEGEEDDLDAEAAVPINLSIVIEKPGKAAGALNIDATAQDGAIVVDNMFFYEDAAAARVDSPEAAQRRADVYPGPPFGSLDDDVQVLMERFLEERGVTQALAVFVPDYVDVKEQKEYVRWLGNVKAFVDA